MTPSPRRGGRSHAHSDNDRAIAASLQGFRRWTRSRLAREVVSEGVARRRDASRVPQMCPECVRVFGW